MLKTWAALGPVIWTSQLSEIALAPCCDASVCAAARSEIPALFASTRTMWQLGHSADTASRSREISSSHESLVLAG